MDIMYINSNPIIHIVDEKTKLCAAELFPDMSTRTVWKTILKLWCKIYAVFPNRILADQGNQF